MATCDQPSDLVLRIPYPSRQRSGLRIDTRIAALPTEEEKRLPVRSAPQVNDAGKIFYFIEPRPRNPWAAMGSLIFLCAVLLALIIVPLLHTDPLPKREMVTMLYLQPPAAASSTVTKFEAPVPVSTFEPKTNAISAPVHPAPDVPATPVATAGGVVGGVPGG